MIISLDSNEGLYRVKFGVDPELNFAEAHVARGALTIGPFAAKEASINEADQLRMSKLAIAITNGMEDDKTSTRDMEHLEIELLAGCLNRFVRITPAVLEELEISYNLGNPSAGYALNSRRIEAVMASSMVQTITHLNVAIPTFGSQTSRQPAGYNGDRSGVTRTITS